jgi:hypothetical protein
MSLPNNAPALERRGCVAIQFAHPWRGVGEARRSAAFRPRA